MDYNPYAAPRAEYWAPQSRRVGPGPWTIVVQAVLIAILLSLHGLMLLGGLVQISEGEAGLSLRKFNDARGEEKIGEAIGELLVYFVSVVWGPASIVWGFANIVALLSKARWYYKSLFAYWIINLLVCLCSPFGLVGLIHLVLSKPPAEGGPS